MIDYRAPTRSERQTVHVVSLCPVRRQNHHTAPDRRRLTADRQFTDGARSRQITLHQRRRKTARVHVIEPKCRIVARQQRRGVDLERQEIADSILVFGSVETSECFGPPRLGCTGRRFVQSSLEIRY